MGAIAMERRIMRTIALDGPGAARTGYDRRRRAMAAAKGWRRQQRPLGLTADSLTEVSRDENPALMSTRGVSRRRMRLAPRDATHGGL